MRPIVLLPFPPLLRALTCLLLAASAWAATPGPDALRLSLALFVLIGGLWMTQALPLSITALLVPLLATLFGLADLRSALAPFAHPIIFLFLGGFALAAALQYQGLDQALAHAVLRAAGGHRARAVVGLCALAAALSMWISNTATAAMMLPLALGLLRRTPGDGAGLPARTLAGAAAPASGAAAAAQTEDHGASEIGPREQIYVLLALAYSTSIGGIATLVGSPPNAIAAAQAGIGFTQWLAFGLPAALLLWPLMMGLLWLLLRPALGGRVVTAHAPLAWTRERRITVAIFGLTVAGWIGGGALAAALGLAADTDSLVALAAVVALVATGCLRWGELESRSHWGVLLLFGGGLALSALMQDSGASRFLAEGMLALVEGTPPLLVVLALVAFVVFLTELVSNTASAALVLPILLPVAPALGLSPQAAAAAVAIAASCAFMLPVATPPNALVFATERVPQATMMRCGLVLNFACVAVITGLMLAATSGR